MSFNIGEGIDVKENALVSLDSRILKILLRDKSREYESAKNKTDKEGTRIIWATEDDVPWKNIKL